MEIREKNLINSVGETTCKRNKLTALSISYFTQKTIKIGLRNSISDLNLLIIEKRHFRTLREIEDSGIFESLPLDSILNAIMWDQG